MGKIVNRAKMTVGSAPGTGAITLGSAVPGFQSFSAAGVNDQDLVSYVMEDGTAWEVGQGTYTASGTSLARTSIQASSNSGAAISASSGAIVYVTALGGDFATFIRGDTQLSGLTAAQLFQLVKNLAQVAAFQSLTFASTTPWDMSQGFNAKLTLTGNTTLGAPSNSLAGLTYVLLLTQDSTGSRTVTWPAGFDWGAAGAPTLTTTAGKTDAITLFCTSPGTFLAFLNGKGF